MRRSSRYSRSSKTSISSYGSAARRESIKAEEEDEEEKLRTIKQFDLDGLDRLKPEHSSSPPARVRISAILDFLEGDSLTEVIDSNAPFTQSGGGSYRISTSRGSRSSVPILKNTDPSAPVKNRGMGQGVEWCEWCRVQCLGHGKDGCQDCVKRRCKKTTTSPNAIASGLLKLKAEQDRREEEARCKRIPVRKWDPTVAWNRRIQWETTLTAGRRDEELSREGRDGESRRHAPVVVIGAGMAGLSAAEALHGYGFKNITLLEASNRVGGRIYTTNLGSDQNSVIDLGVSELEHLEEWNTVFALARKQGLLNSGLTTLHLRSGQSTKAVPGEEVVCKDRKAVYYNMMIDHEIATLNELNARSSRPDNKVIHLSSKDYFRETLRRMQGHLDKKLSLDLSPENAADDSAGEEKPLDTSRAPLCPSVTSAVEAYVKEIKYQHGDHRGDADVQTFTTNHNRSFTSVKDGMSSILKPLTSWFKSKPNVLKLNARVNRIDWTQFTKEKLRKGKHPMLEIACHDGRVFQASHVIITTPLGFLKSEALTLFNPKLPERKLNVIERLGFGGVCKAFIRFESPVLRRGFYIALTIQNEDDVRTKSKIEKIIVNFKASPSSSVVEVTFSNSTPEKMDDADLLNDLIIVLESRLLRPMPPVVGLTKSSWRKDALYRGTHPYVKVSGSQKDAEILAQPIRLDSNPVIQFAGDATHRDYKCLLHAARASGLREAERLNDVYDTLYGLGNVNNKTTADWEL